MGRRALDPTGSSSTLDELLAALAAVYRDADALYAGWSCPASTECCRFGVTGREPYVTSIELAAVKKAVAARGGARSWRRAAPLPIARDERTCPLLNDAGRCSIYEARPLGCRTFFCHRAEPGGRVEPRDLRELVRRIQAIAQRHEPGGDQGRPLVRAL